MKKKNLETEKPVEVLLVNMPFDTLTKPSLGLGLLKAGLSTIDITSKVIYFSLRFAKIIGEDLFNIFSLGYRSTRDVVGEWCFTGALFTQTKEDINNYLNKILLFDEASEDITEETRLKEAEEIAEILKTREKVNDFLEECLKKVLSYSPKIVGFSCMYSQTIASLALARLIKEQSSDTFIVFGGANCDGIMGRELINQFSFVDAVVSGEGDIVFPKLVQKVISGSDPSGLTGVITQANIKTINPRMPLCAPQVANLDTLPYPDFDDYFEQIEENHLTLKKPLRLGMETSRGCWWAEKAQCMFCGLNAQTETFRAKTADRALREIEFLSSTYPGYDIAFSDNILNIEFFKDFIPELEQRQFGLDFFYEVRTNLTKDQVRLLHKAGIRSVQPGIESLSTPILKLMRKGVTALQNIQLLKWCKEYAIKTSWNILWGFPGESTAEYIKMAELFPLITHLSPPVGAARFCLARYSPYFVAPKKYGLTKVSPTLAQFFIFPFAPEVVSNLSNGFEYKYESPQETKEHIKTLLKSAIRWKEAHRGCELFSVDDGKELKIWDERPITKKLLIILTGLQRELYIACDAIKTKSQLQNIVSNHFGNKVSQEKIDKALDQFISQDLMIKDGRSYLSLAIPVGTYAPVQPALRRFQNYLKRRSESSFLENVKVADLSKNEMVTRGEILGL